MYITLIISAVLYFEVSKKCDELLQSTVNNEAR